jgi:hypothetical protein
VNFRQTAAQFFQNVADYLHEDKPPLFVPDYVTGEPHIVTSLEKQKAYHNLSRYMQKHLPDFVVVMHKDENGEFQPSAVHKSAPAYLNCVSNPNYKPEKSGYIAPI